MKTKKAPTKKTKFRQGPMRVEKVVETAPQTKEESALRAVDQVIAGLVADLAEWRQLKAGIMEKIKANQT